MESLPSGLLSSTICTPAVTRFAQLTQLADSVPFDGDPLCSRGTLFVHGSGQPSVDEHHCSNRVRHKVHQPFVAALDAEIILKTSGTVGDSWEK